MAENLKPRTALLSLILSGALLELLFLSLYVFPSGGASVVGFIVVHTAACVVLGVLWWQRSRLFSPSSGMTRNVILAFAILFRGSLLLHPPVCSEDIYRYLWDGKVLLHGVNPYAYAPDDPRLADLSSPLLPSRLNHASLGTVYPPVAEAFFAVAYGLVGESVLGFKLLFEILDIGSLLLLVRLLRRLGRSEESVILYAWSPLPILYGALDGHVDVIGIPFLILLLANAADHRQVRSAIATACGALVKLHPIIIAPLYLRTRPWRRGVAACGVAILLFAAAYLPFASHIGDELRWLRQFGENWEFNGGIFSVVFALVNDNQKAHTVMNVLLVAWVGWLTLRNADFTEKVFLALLGMMLFSPLVHPWYLLWLAAIIAVRWSPSVFLLLGLSAFSNIIVYRYVTYGEWIDDPWIVALQYVPFFWRSHGNGDLRLSAAVCVSFLKGQGMGRVSEFNEFRTRMNERILGTENRAIKRFFGVDTLTYEPGALDAKTKEMLGLVASMVLRCDDCISYHIQQCKKEGVTDSEMEDVFSVALVVGGSIVVPHLRRGVAFLDELNAQSK